MTLCELKLQMNDEFPQLDITESSIGNCVPYALTIQSSVWPVTISLFDDQGTVRMWIDRCPLIEPYGTSILPTLRELVTRGFSIKRQPLSGYVEVRVPSLGPGVLGASGFRWPMIQTEEVHCQPLVDQAE